jgi:hypothetical protein
MKTYKAEVTYIGKKLRKKGSFEEHKTYEAVIDLHEAHNGNEILTLRRPAHTKNIERYYDSWATLKTDFDIINIEEV